MDAIRTTREILSIKSPSGQEEELACYVQEKLASLGIKCKEYAHSKTSKSIVAKTGGKEKLCINCHLDVVPYAGTPVKEDENYLYGPGAVDTKKDIGPLLSALSKMDEIPEGLVLAFDADEEYYNTGILAIYKDIRAPKVIINEATGLQANYGWLGWAIATISARGRQMHSCYGGRGNSYNTLLGVCAKTVQSKFKKKDKLGESGVQVREMVLDPQGHTFVPPKAACKLLVLQNTHYNSPRKIAQEIGRGEKNISVGVSDFFPAHIGKRNGLAKELSLLSGRGVGLDRAWTNAHYFKERDTVIFGCGEYLRAHTNEERVPKKQLLQLEQIYLRLMEKIQKNS
ncbi:MAG: M20/M25/M40 family metallo-hydrolase [Candidatus Micrarchaeia archaeon]